MNPEECVTEVTMCISDSARSSLLGVIGGVGFEEGGSGEIGCMNGK